MGSGPQRVDCMRRSAGGQAEVGQPPNVPFAAMSGCKEQQWQSICRGCAAWLWLCGSRIPDCGSSNRESRRFEKDPEMGWIFSDVTGPANDS